MVTTIEMQAEPRDKRGKGVARSLRRDGKVPAIIYGKGKENVNIALNEQEIIKYYRKANFNSLLMNIVVEGKNYHVIPRAVQLHPVTDVAEHIDFLHISQDSTVKVKVNIHFLNEEKCLGIKRGGMLNIVKRNLSLQCSPHNIPHHIELDIANLNIGDSIHINDIKLPEGTSAISSEGNFTIITVVGRAKDEAKDEAAAAKAPAAK